MKKVLISLTNQQIEIIDSIVKKLGISRSEFIRRIIDKVLANIEKKKEASPKK
jgi:metal-responsive CopG/Arc/MetJ family transcriptional regulator